MSNRLASAQAERLPGPSFAYRSEAEVMREVRELRAQAVQELMADWRARRAAKRAAQPANSNVGLPMAEQMFYLQRANEARGEMMVDLMVRFARWVARKVRTWRGALADARAMHELAELDDRMLADIGITRSDIPAAVRRMHGDVTPEQTPAKPVSERLAA